MSLPIEAQEAYMDHLTVSLQTFKQALRHALAVDDNRESHLGDATAARDELCRSYAQLMGSLGIYSRNYCGSPLTTVVVPIGASFDAQWPSVYGVDKLRRGAYVEPEDQARDWIVFSNPQQLLPRL